MRRLCLASALLAVLAAACGGSGNAQPDAGQSDAGQASDGGTADIAVPASIRDQPAGQASITDPAYFTGFTGSHFFARGGLAPFNGGTPALITDCRLTLSATGLTVEGGGQTVSAPFISNNPNAKTAIIVTPDSLHIGSNKTLSFYEVSGSGINVVIAGDRVTAVGALKTGVSIACNSDYASNETTDRSADTFALSSSAVGAIVANAGTSSSYTQKNVGPSDLGGAAGTATLGAGVLVLNGTAQRITDCKVVVTGGMVTISGGGGAVSETGTFTGAAADVVQVVQVPGSPAQLSFRPGSNNARLVLNVNGFGFVRNLNASKADGTAQMTCP